MLVHPRRGIRHDTGRGTGAERWRPPEPEALRPRPGPEAGFTLIGLLIVVAIVNITFATVVATWSFVDQRAKEAELIWRGREYARGIQCYTAKHNRFPDTLEELVEEGCLRRLYRDPMTRSGEWRLINASDLQEESGEADEDGLPASLRGLLDGEGADDGASDGASGRRRQSRLSELMGRDSGIAQDDPAPRRRRQRRRRGSEGRESRMRGSGSDLEGIVGVGSTSRERPIRQIPGLQGDVYADWKFTYGMPPVPGFDPGLVVLRSGSMPGQPAGGLPGTGEETRTGRRRDRLDRSERPRGSGTSSRSRRESSK